MKLRTVTKTTKYAKTSRNIKKNEALMALRGIWKDKKLSWKKDVDKSWATWSRSF